MNFCIGKYDQKLLMAAKALKDKPSFEHPRLPNPTWSGFGFSSSMPDSSIKSRFSQDRCAKYNQNVIFKINICY